MTDVRTVSVIISNFNYAAFLGVAIQSALDQSYPAAEIIVVDDGSTDNSREVIESFGERIIGIFKENGGQRSACNAGFSASTGDIVLFLDGDDAWRSDAVEKVVAAMQAGVAAVQFCVAILDQDGRQLGGIYPPLPKNWTPRRIRDCVLKSGFYPFPPTSGNAYARWFLDRIMPIPVGPVRDAMDGPLNTVAPLYGDVVVLKEPLGFYRIHGTNVGAMGNMVPEKFSYFVDLDRDRGAFLMEQARQLGVPLDAHVLDRAFFYLQYRTGVAASCAPTSIPWHRIACSICLSCLPAPQSSHPSGRCCARSSRSGASPSRSPRDAGRAISSRCGSSRARGRLSSTPCCRRCAWCAGQRSGTT